AGGCMLSARFRQPEQFLPRVQALVWDFASAAPSALDWSPPGWFVAASRFGGGPSQLHPDCSRPRRRAIFFNVCYFLPTEHAMTCGRALVAPATGLRFPTPASS